MELIVLKKRPILLSVFAIFVIFILINSLTVSADVMIINETFDSDVNWTFESYTSEWSEEWDSFRWDLTDLNLVSISDSVLQFTDLNPSNYSYFDLDIGIAMIDCSVLYGEWSFDFKADENYSDFGFTFSYSMDSELDGKAENEFKAAGYAVALSTSDAGSRNRGVHLWKYNGSQFGIKNPITIPTTFSGWDHFVIERATDNTITVTMNNQQLFSWKDESPVDHTPESLWLLNFHGNTQIDNLTVIEYENSSEGGNVNLETVFLLSGVTIAATFTILVYPKTKKNY